MSPGPLPEPSPLPALTLPFLGQISDPRLLGLLQSALILVLAYLLARIVASGAGRLLMARARRTAPPRTTSSCAR